MRLQQSRSAAVISAAGMRHAMIGAANRRSDSNETPTLPNGFIRPKYRFPLSFDATRARKLQVTQVAWDEPHLEPSARSTVSGRWGEREFYARIPVCTGRRCGPHSCQLGWLRAFGTHWRRIAYGCKGLQPSELFRSAIPLPMVSRSGSINRLCRNSC